MARASAEPQRQLGRTDSTSRSTRRGRRPLRVASSDKIDAWVLAELTRRALVPEIWLPTPEVRAERERARFRLHLIRHRSALKNRIHATLMTFGHPCPMADLFGVAGRLLLNSLKLPQPWQATMVASLSLVDDLTARVELARQLAEAIWHVLSKNEPFAPAGPAMSLVA